MPVVPASQLQAAMERTGRCANPFTQNADAPKSTGPLNLFSHRPRKKEPFGSRRSAFIQGSSIIDSKDGGVPYSPNQRARREEQKFSLSIRNPTEGA